jgi:hypothetical protein
MFFQLTHYAIPASWHEVCPVLTKDHIVDFDHKLFDLAIGLCVDAAAGLAKNLKHAQNLMIQLAKRTGASIKEELASPLTINATRKAPCLDVTHTFNFNFNLCFLAVPRFYNAPPLSTLVYFGVLCLHCSLYIICGTVCDIDLL